MANFGVHVVDIIPPEKLYKILRQVRSILQDTKVSAKDLQSLIGRCLAHLCMALFETSSDPIVSGVASRSHYDGGHGPCDFLSFSRPRGSVGFAAFLCR